MADRQGWIGRILRIYGFLTRLGNCWIAFLDQEGSGCFQATRAYTIGLFIWMALLSNRSEGEGRLKSASSFAPH